MHKTHKSAILLLFFMEVNFGLRKCWGSYIWTWGSNRNV